jgi:hypothetical protein
MVYSVVKICSYDSNLSSSSIRTTSRAFWIEPRKRNYAISSYVCTRCKKSGEVEKEGRKLCSLFTLFAYLTLDEIKKNLCNKPIYYDLSKKLNYYAEAIQVFKTVDNAHSYECGFLLLEFTLFFDRR